MATLSSTFSWFDLSKTLHIRDFSPVQILAPSLKSRETEENQLRLLTSFKKCSSSPSSRLSASREPSGLAHEQMVTITDSNTESENEMNLFAEMKYRFLNFKQHKYMENSWQFQNLAKGQVPKFMVVACADSRVCPSNILGFQPGEAFTVRNVANLIPQFESGPSETKAALEFAVNSLNIKNILVVGHSCCGGIRALMSMQDDEEYSFIQSWVSIGKNARLNTRAVASDLSFDQQCRHCEKESINHSLVNLLGYPWIEERVMNGMVSLHGGYYNFVNCSFEKWTLACKGGRSSGEEDVRYLIKNTELWS